MLGVSPTKHGGIMYRFMESGRSSRQINAPGNAVQRHMETPSGTIAVVERVAVISFVIDHEFCMCTVNLHSFSKKRDGHLYPVCRSRRAASPAHAGLESSSKMQSVLHAAMF